MAALFRKKYVTVLVPDARRTPLMNLLSIGLAQLFYQFDGRTMMSVGDLTVTAETLVFTSTSQSAVHVRVPDIRIPTANFLAVYHEPAFPLDRVRIVHQHGVLRFHCWWAKTFAIQLHETFIATSAAHDGVAREPAISERPDSSSTRDPWTAGHRSDEWTPPGRTPARAWRSQPVTVQPPEPGPSREVEPQPPEWIAPEPARPVASPPPGNTLILERAIEVLVPGSLPTLEMIVQTLGLVCVPFLLEGCLRSSGVLRVSEDRLHFEASKFRSLTQVDIPDVCISAADIQAVYFQSSSLLSVVRVVHTQGVLRFRCLDGGWVAERLRATFIERRPPAPAAAPVESAEPAPATREAPAPIARSKGSTRKSRPLPINRQKS